MPHSNQKARRPGRFAEYATSATALFLAVALGAGCGSEPPRGLLDGSWPTGNCGTSTPPPGMQYTCTPDPGSQPADCVGDEANLDLLTIGDFSPPGDLSVGYVPKANHLYAYTDSTAAIASFSGGWEPNTESNPFPRCNSQQPDNALHIQGGPFLGWGGGVGMGAKDLGVVQTALPNGCSQPSDSLCVLSSEDYPDAEMDVSAYEGVAVWARRGPDSQGGIRVLVADKYTEDDISYKMYREDPARPRYCERVRECGCTNHQACQEWAQNQSPADKFKLLNSSSCGPPPAQPLDSLGNPPSTFFCGDPTSNIVPGSHSTGGADFGCFTCGATRCWQDYPAFPGGDSTIQPVGSPLPDTQFNRKPCTPYTTRSGISSAYCFDPAIDPPPAESDQTCGDHWTTPIYLTNEWRLYLVPFTSMIQQGFGKKSPKMYLPGVTAIRLTWDGGYIDYWIGKISLYRHKS
jgi:hypothetical protein